MKPKILISRLLGAIALAAFAGSSVSCMTTYDAYGRPVQSVDPAAAVAGAAAAGILGYAIANNNNDHHHYNRGYYRGGYYRGGGGYYGRGYR
ncbi:MAG: hypothetical protein RLZZ214_4173, partial [Verrucomicrobiota bacterium]|jgi:hypothetical protein